MSELYNCDFSSPTEFVEFGEYQVPLPKKPPVNQMVNYGLPKDKQKFYKTEVPKSLLKRKAVLSREEQKFILDEYHKRKNGVWILINGRHIYITGRYYFFLNYWHTQKLVQPDFRYVQCLIFLLWEMVVRDADAYGLNLIGPRRIGKTEFTLAEMYEYITRVKNTNGHMQSKNNDTAGSNFRRIAKANKKTIWFMKPIHDGAEEPKDRLDFKYPSKRFTDKQAKDMADNPFYEDENAYTESELGSYITFFPSIEVAVDGQETNRGILNESGKLENMSLIKWWQVFKPTLHRPNGEIIGKCWVESTIEEMNDDQIDEVNTFWQDSNPKERNDNGRTTNGLYRIFISYYDAYDEDAFGFPKKEEAEIKLNNELSHLKKKNKLAEISALLRKQPRTVEDALVPSGAQSAFNKDRLQDILKRLDYPESFDLPVQSHTVKGNFIWANGVPDTKVVFVPNEADGKFIVSQLLKDGMDNAQVLFGGIKFPGNLRYYRGGCDPYEHDEVVDLGRASKGGGVIMRMYNDSEDGAKKYDDGLPFDYAWDWVTKQPVCDYVFREDDPDVFFEDMLMMHVYYGTQMLFENNKRSIKNHFRKRGYGEYIMPRPEATFDERSYQQRGITQNGAPATTDTIQQYFDAIAHYVMNYSNAIKHRRIVVDLLEMNKKNRGRHDLGVATGWALLACEKQYARLPEDEVYEDSNEPSWFTYQAV